MFLLRMLSSDGQRDHDLEQGADKDPNDLKEWPRTRAWSKPHGHRLTAAYVGRQDVKATDLTKDGLFLDKPCRLYVIAELIHTLIDHKAA